MDKFAIEADLHVHTVASGHAYSTVDEITKQAAQVGLKMVAITDHGPCLPGGAHKYHFWNLRVMPEQLNGVLILKGVEANITDQEAGLDLEPEYLEPLELVHAGFHPNCGYDNRTVALNTDVLVKAMDNPFVDFIVHPGNAKFPIDPKTLVDAAAEKGVALEINNSSFLPSSSRSSALDFDLPLAHYAAERGIPIILSSDAHIYTQVGVVDKAAELVESAGIREEQVLNASIERVLEYLAMRRAKR